jgi:hypothetical protein
MHVNLFTVTPLRCVRSDSCAQPEITCVNVSAARATTIRNFASRWILKLQWSGRSRPREEEERLHTYTDKQCGFFSEVRLLVPRHSRDCCAPGLVLSY